MSNNRAKLVRIIKEEELEIAITDYKAIDNAIKILEAKKSLLKDSLIKSYFAANDCYYNTDGKLVASYKAQIRQTFQTTEFKEVHLNLYNQFTKPQEIFVFLVK